MKTAFVKTYGRPDARGSFSAISSFEGEVIYDSRIHGFGRGMDSVRYHFEDYRFYELHLDKCETGETIITSIVDDKGNPLKSLTFCLTFCGEGGVLEIGDCLIDKLGLTYLTYDPFVDPVPPEFRFGNDPTSLHEPF